ncbi:hypothetical protein PV08_02813 [Exophiala spinifera]|uniref:Xylanolytic transcriptional activator regulatory domain-containing protein n=1 Tax=Exophiala spinifera TaxID=91928 RepID=A0A0D2BIZ6_9EURO|nr:uncharacterized protein PV08_02813 [Exophiala spinifera]KIW18525.1 hypothetical protein PV08_02813 [Exophiala spinifera]
MANILARHVSGIGRQLLAIIHSRDRDKYLRGVEKISQTLQDYRGVLQKLFPNMHPDQLREMSRDSLVELISKRSPCHPPSPRTPSVDEKPHLVNPEAGSLEQLQPMPEEGSEVLDQRSTQLRGMTDDVSILSMHVKQNPSYLGISSVMAVLRVITWLNPDCLSDPPDQNALMSRDGGSSPSHQLTESGTTPGDTSSSTAWDEIPLINAYFTYVHPFIPLLEEQSFRDTYMAASRTDTGWLLLLNAVLVMGSIANSSAEDTAHLIYYERAKQYLTIEVLDSAHLETIQALAILSGFYLHYVQSPNQANSLMGSTLKLATTLGLHRDYSEGVGPAKAEKAAYSIEMRRRVWWSTFMLDTWAGNSLGRPSMGRLSPAITAKLPQEPIGQSHTLLSLVRENIRFCEISTRMEDALACSPLLEETERRDLEAMYCEWFKHSSVAPASPRSTTADPPGTTTLKNVMRWRYYTNRIYLHRPALLWYAMRRMKWENLSSEKKAAIELCREACADLINDIATTWRGQKPCQMAGWNANWLMYQAVMVPLLSLYSDTSDATVVSSSQQQVETAMATMRDLQMWSTTAKRSLEVVVRLYESSKHSDGALGPSASSEVLDVCVPSNMTPKSTSDTLPQQQQPHQQQEQQVQAQSQSQSQSESGFRPSYIDVSYANTYGATTAQPLSTAGQEVYMDNMFDTIRWSTSWDSPMGGPQMSHGWDYNSMQHWAGMPHADEYFDVGGGFNEDQSQLGFDLDMQQTQTQAPTSIPSEMMRRGQYGHENMAGGIRHRSL